MPGTGMVQATPTPDVTVTALSKEKLAQEVQQLKNQNDRSRSAWFWNSGGLLGTVVAALLAVAGVLATVVVNFRQWKETQDKDRIARQDAQDKDRKDRETEREKRAEERFQKVVEGFGSERTEAKVGAAITLRTFLQPGYERFYRQAFDLAVAHLRLRKAEASAPEPPSSPDHVLIIPQGDLRQEQQPSPTASIPPNSLSQALITVFKEAFPLARNELKKANAQFDPQLLDATNVQLDHAYLAGADLAEAWLVQASLREADLSGAQLQGAHLSNTQLIGANLSEAQLTGANLSEAQLQRARLIKAQIQGANLIKAQLQRARLISAELQGANLTDAQLQEANLTGAQLQEADLWHAQIQGAHLLWAQLQGATLSYAQIQGAHLLWAQLQGATLSSGQREMCLQKGAIFDNIQQVPTFTTNSSSSPPSAQSNDAQGPAAPPAQVNTPPSDADEGSTTSSQQSNGAQAPSASPAQVTTPPPDTEGNGAASSKLGPAS